MTLVRGKLERGYVMDSILTSVKKQLGIPEEYEHFDPELIMHINSALMTVTQLGVGPVEGFAIKDSNDIWDDLVTDNLVIGWVKSYVGLRVRMLFDPPDRGAVKESIERTLTEYEWRIQVAADPPLIPGEEDNI